MPVWRKRFTKALSPSSTGAFREASKESVMTAIPQPYRHVVLFRFRPGVAEETVRGVEAAFGDLARQLSFVTGFEWGRNESPEGLDKGFTHCFLVTFAGPEGRDAYLPHPAHEAFCRTWLDPNLEEACVLDFPAHSGK
jgi:hypothetical protein